MSPYTMPAEWQRHESTWLAWPKDPATFPPDLIRNVEETYISIIKGLTKGERVDLLVDNEQTRSQVASMLETSESSKVRFHILKSADVWMRDYGPIFVKDKKSESVVAVKWVFNAWGNKYDELKLDNETGMKVAQSTGYKIVEPKIVLEGGSIDVNGMGTCLTTRQCLLNRNRNHGLSQEEITKSLEMYLGATNLIWLEKGISGDDTDGHVDDIARFVDEKTIVCMVAHDYDDENRATLDENYEILRSSIDQDGAKLKIIQIEMPEIVDSPDGRLPASYANFYIANTCVLVPVFNDTKHDRAALETLRQLFPDRAVVGVDCRSLVYGLGGIHCITQQQPL